MTQLESDGFSSEPSSAQQPNAAKRDPLFLEWIRWLLDRDPEYAAKLLGRKP